MYRVPSAPQRIGSVLDSGFSLFGASLKGAFLFAVVPALAYAPVVRLARGAAASPDEGTTFWPMLAAGTLVALVLYVILGGALIAHIHAVSIGTRPPLAQSLAAGRNRAWSFLGTGLLVAIIVSLGFVLVVPGIYLLVMLLFSVVAAVVEHKGPIASLGFSRDLVRGHWWRTALLVCVIGFVMLVLYVLITVVVGIATAIRDPAALAEGRLPWYVDFVVSPLMAGVLGPLFYSLLIAAYNDLKLRREGADLTGRVAAAEA